MSKEVLLAASTAMQGRGVQTPCDSRDLGDGGAGRVEEECRYERGWERARPSHGDRAGSSSPVVVVSKRDAGLGAKQKWF